MSFPVAPKAKIFAKGRTHLAILIVTMVCKMKGDSISTSSAFFAFAVTSALNTQTQVWPITPDLLIDFETTEHLVMFDGSLVTGQVRHC